MIAFSLQLAALAGLCAAVTIKYRRPMLAVSLLCVVTGLGLGFAQNTLDTFALPWAVGATASLFPLISGLMRKESAGVAAGLATALTWPAGSAFIWQSTGMESMTPGGWITGLLLALVLGSTALALCSALHNEQDPLQRNHRQLLVLCTLILTLVLPWAGRYGEVPLALTGSDHALGPASTLQILWSTPPQEVPLEISMVASTSPFFLGVLRKLALALSILSLFFLICARILRSQALRQFVSTTVTTTALAALLIPIAGFALAAFTTTPPDQLILAATEEMRTNIYFRGLVHAPEGLQYHLLGLPVPAALLPALCVALLKSLHDPGQDTLPTVTSASTGMVQAIAFQFVAILFILSAPMVGWPSMLMTQSPWPAILAATIITCTSAMVTRFGAVRSPLITTGLWTAFAMLLLGLLGPGEGWFIS